MTFEAPTVVPPDVLAALTQASERFGVPLRVLAGIAWVESRFKASAVGPEVVHTVNGARVSQGNARGLMQLMPATARGLGVSDPHDIYQAANGGAKYLARLRGQFAEWGRATAAYYWGEGNVAKHVDPLTWPADVRRYVQEVAAAGGSVPLPFQGDALLIQVPTGGLDGLLRLQGLPGTSGRAGSA